MEIHPPEAGAAELIRTAIDRGVNFFDTADVYSEGEAERILGGALKKLGIARKDIVIATKVRKSHRFQAPTRLDCRAAIS